jgi:hypothetical protein
MEDIFEISVEDLDLIKQLIEIASQKGIIPLDNFIQVGSLYEKIVNVISKIDYTVSD